MTKEDILHHFQDINFYYNDCRMYDDLSRMLDELIAENEGKSIDISVEESEDQSVEWYCTDCPYFQFTGEPSTDWYGTRCNKDNHEASPSMYAIQSLNDDCPLNRG